MHIRKIHFDSLSWGRLFFRVYNRLRHRASRESNRQLSREKNLLEKKIPQLIVHAERASLPRIDTEVHMMLGSDTWLMAIWACRSFEYASGFSWDWVFQDDGTLGSDQILHLQDLLQSCEFRGKLDSDTKIEEALKKFPACDAARKKHIMFGKMFGPYFHSDKDRYILLDSDILFFGPPLEIVEWARSDSPHFLFNQDIQSAYAVSPNLLSSHFGCELLPRVNAGLALVPKKYVSLEVVEEFLEKFESKSSHDLWLEQTAYALLASLQTESTLLPKTYEISFSPTRSKNCVARHYVGGNLSRPHFFREGVIELAKNLL